MTTRTLLHFSRRSSLAWIPLALLVACGSSHEPSGSDGGDECRVVPQSGCPDGMGCLPGPEVEEGSTRCIAVGTLELGDECEQIGDCSPGLVCHFPARTMTDTGVCLAFCELAANPDCLGVEVLGFPLAQGTGIQFQACASTADCTGDLECREAGDRLVCH